jgi:hypothetical protein
MYFHDVMCMGWLTIQRKLSSACLLFHLNSCPTFIPDVFLAALVAQRRSDRCCSLARFLPSFLPCVEQDCGVRQPWRMDCPLEHRQIARSASLKSWKEKMSMVERRVRWIWPISDQVCVVCFFSFLAPFSSKFIGNFLRSFPSLRSPKLAYKFQSFRKPSGLNFCVCSGFRVRYPAIEKPEIDSLFSPWVWQVVVHLWYASPL